MPDPTPTGTAPITGAATGISSLPNAADFDAYTAARYRRQAEAA